MNTGKKELETLKNKWLNYLNDKPVEEFKPEILKNSKIPEINNLSAVKALIMSLQNNLIKEQLTKNV